MRDRGSAATPRGKFFGFFIENHRKSSKNARKAPGSSRKLPELPRKVPGGTRPLCLLTKPGTRIRDVCGKRYSEPDDVRCQCCINIDILTDSLLAVQLATYVTRRGHPRYVGKVACVSSNVPCVTSSQDLRDVHVCVQTPVHHVLLATALHVVTATCTQM